MDKLQQSRQTRRFLAVTVFFTLVLLGIVARLYFLQVVKGSYYAGVAEDNRLRIISTAAPRGEIRDRNGVVLATDIPSFDIVVTTYDLENADQELGVVAAMTGVKLQTLKDTVDKAGVGPFTPITVARNVSKSAALKLAEREPDLPGVQLVMSTKRSYPLGSLAAHVLGYTGEIGGTELQLLRADGYVMKDTIGKDGIELQYESLLRGEKSQKLIEVDAGGKAVKTLQENPAAPGKSIILTIDARLQKTCEELLGDNQGAAIMMDPRNGDLLALASAPTFDPNKFISGVSSEDWKSWSAKGSLFDRAIAGSFPPASTFKVVTGTAGLETHTVTDRSIIYCGGGLTVGGRLFKCWIWPGGHGNEDIYKAYADSCDTYFWTVARLVGIESLDTYARKFGLDKPTGIDLPGETTGFYPTPQWKLGKFKEPWYEGDTMNMGIGQGYVLETPVRNISIFSSIAMNGTLWRPHLLKASVDPVTKVETQTTPVVQDTLGISTATLTTVKKGLNLVSKTGGMTRIQVGDIEICAKTGTAETGTPNLYHTWLVAFAPMENPEVAVLLMYENSPYERSTSMAPLVHTMLQQYFDLYGGKNGIN
ncbi:MAG: penicillin-binding protein 2 [Caldiserica bacterium]|nr:penicillin-binding protein 2 [Caldisericota bacterium]